MKSFIQKGLLALVLCAATYAPMVQANTDLPTGIIERQQCGNTIVDVRGFGAGLMYQPAPIVPQNDRVIDVRPAEGCAVIEWTTPIVATSQVIIAEVGTQPESVDATNPPYYWYPAGTTQNADAVGVHRVVVNNLTPGKKYSYRLVSRSHPTATPYITEEKFLTVPTTFVPTTTVPSVPSVPAIVPTVPSASGSTPTVAITTSTTQPKVTYTTKTITTTQVVSVPEATEPTNVTEPIAALEDVAQTATTPEPTPADETAPIAAITAAASATANPNQESTFWQRFTRAFSFFGFKNTQAHKEITKKETSTETAMLTVQGDPYAQKAAAPAVKESNDNMAKPAKNVVMADRYIVPSLFFLVLLYLLQQMLLPALGMKVEQPLLFWMFGVIAVAIFAALLKLFYVTVFMLAVFLALLAWYILNLFDEAEAKPSTN